MEAMLFAEGVAAWKNFDELEENLILDELLLLHELIGKTKTANYKVLASFQGIDLGDVDGDESAESNGPDLPEELLEAEREWKRKKEEKLESGEAEAEKMASIGLGYTRE